MKKFFEKLYKEPAESFYTLLENDLLTDNRRFVVTANPEAFMSGDSDPEFEKLLLDDATTITPDGIGIVKGAEMMNMPVKERIPGVEIAQKLFEKGSEHKKSIYLFGAKQEVIDALLDVLKKYYPGLVVKGAENGYNKDRDGVFERIKKAQPDIVLVALGIPEQEKLIYKHLKDFDKGIFVGVGGSFDVLSGKKERAPQFFIDYKLEWLYRIVKEPKRIKRFFKSNVKYLIKVKKLSKNK